MSETTTSTTSTLDAEREAALEVLAEQRGFLLHTLKGLNEEQATTPTTVSELTLAGLVKHVTSVEREWMEFIENGEDLDVDVESPEFAKQMEEHARTFRLVDDETLESVLADYDRAASETEEYVRSLPDLERSHQLAPAPWLEGEVFWSARKVLLHLVRETAQHCGHADIIREALDGQKTMG
ncbi:DinB family protein [Nocardiopsis sp. HNM0947]|uniref:DinB family protein n=1 Tax=Nocardiopsis coralli TaxID=2772213 RepID=A0ABR9PAA9_9ACTN|nr:DinB family protein [Nocardiopsis coralli]MBE3000780.1 DinB family protein [Nocardiopsis coralli]